MPSYRPITDTWHLGRPKVPYYGAYPAGFLERARALLPVLPDEPVLHICGGKARLYSDPAHGVKPGVPLYGFGPNDQTLDADPALSPDFHIDVTEPEWYVRVAGAHFLRTGAGWPRWRGLLIDPPYTPEDADHYAPGRAAFPKKAQLLADTLEYLTVVGGRVGVLDYLWVRPPEWAKCIAQITVICGFANRARVYAVYEKRENP